MDKKEERELNEVYARIDKKIKKQIKKRDEFFWIEASIMTILAILIFIAVALSFLDLFLHENNTQTRDVPCYDKYGSKIVGMVCHKKVVCGWGYSTEKCEADK